ncbi:hypothetical protein M426DRAFT_220883 [Hypoxylon sp. CI-4A]|nr:hypothetical protein M426DRAFT_220883 [Hypoxylon sp. CI-4A]
MDSSASTRGRGRKRHTLPTVSSQSQKSSELAEQSLSATPTASMASSSFTRETPSPSASREMRTRTRQVDGLNPSSPEDPTPKGGRSLRKRPRVDYTFEQQLDEIVNLGNKATPGATRVPRRRKTDFESIENGMDEEFEAFMKRRASEQPQSSAASSRRRNTRKSTAEPQTYVPDLTAKNADAEDVEVQDTIEVGGHQSSESDESTLRRTSSGSSSNDSKIVTLHVSCHLLRALGLPPSSQLPQSSQSTQSTRLVQSSRAPQTPASDISHHNNKSPAVKHNGTRLELQSQREEVDAMYDDDDEADVDQTGPDSLAYLTPYIEGSWVCYPEYEDDLELELEPEIELEPELEADTKAESTAEPGLQGDSQEDTEVEAIIAAVQEESDAMNGTIAGDEAIVDDQVIGTAENTPVDTAANSPCPPDAEPEPASAQPMQKVQWRYKETRDASEFTDLFKDVKSLSTTELYRRLDITNEALVAWQDEFKEMKKITDDYDNSIRYHREEESFDRRFNLAVAKNPAANPIQKDFVIKGIRAQDNTENLEKYQRQQDRIEANAYGYEYDHRQDRIGQQDPIAQRTGLGRNGRLRERPKQTAKAALLEEPIIMQGKRTRKAPEKYTGGDEASSRASTPVPTQRRGRRGPRTQEVNGENDAQDQGQNAPTSNPAPEPVEKEPPKKKGKGGRPRKNPLPAPEPEAATTPTAEPQPEADPKLEQEPEPLPDSKPQTRTPPEPELNSGSKRTVEATEEADDQPVRKRRRRGPAPAAAPTDPTPDPVIADEENVQNGVKPQTPSKTGRGRTIKKTEKASEYNNFVPMSSPGVAEEIRPPTASSTATVDTIASTSNYQLREKRQRKFTNDINDEDFIEEPKPKRTRRAPKKSAAKADNVTSAPEPHPAKQPEPEVPATPKRTLKIKLKPKAPLDSFPVDAPSAPSLNPSTGSTPPKTNGQRGTVFNINGKAPTNGATEPNGADEGDDDPNKTYTTLTKSEKMSKSMKARWKSGSMNGAVEKRRATLAAKKQSAATPTPTPTTNGNGGGGDATGLGQ